MSLLGCIVVCECCSLSRDGIKCSKLRKHPAQILPIVFIISFSEEGFGSIEELSLCPTPPLELRPMAISLTLLSVSKWVVSTLFSGSI